jgi:hypothetical protein
MNVITASNGVDFLATGAITSALSVLSSMPRGGFATARNYVSESGRVEAQVADMSFISRFSGYNRTQKELDALQSLDLSTVSFENRDVLGVALAELVASKKKTLSGDRSDNRRKSHDTFYAPICEGVKVHLKTEKIDGETRLVKIGGLPVAKSVNVMAIEINRNVKVAGEYKKVNSRPKTLAKKAIEKAIRTKVLPLRSLSLQEGKFDSLAIGGTTISDKDVSTNISLNELTELFGTVS